MNCGECRRWALLPNASYVPLGCSRSVCGDFAAPALKSRLGSLDQIRWNDTDATFALLFFSLSFVHSSVKRGHWFCPLGFDFPLQNRRRLLVKGRTAWTRAGEWCTLARRLQSIFFFSPDTSAECIKIMTQTLKGGCGKWGTSAQMRACVRACVHARAPIRCWENRRCWCQRLIATEDRLTRCSDGKDRMRSSCDVT